MMTSMAIHPLMMLSFHGLLVRDHPDQPDTWQVIRLKMSLFFGNCEAFKEIFYQILPKGPTKLRAIVVDAAGDGSVKDSLDVMMSTCRKCIYREAQPPILARVRRIS